MFYASLPMLLDSPAEFVMKLYRASTVCEYGRGSFYRSEVGKLRQIKSLDQDGTNIKFRKNLAL